ncbi:MarR family transcriptional regulator [Nocardia sp. NPDC051981]|uniref:MarR family transcriptional regulator n=1 Tax=Nocardia sp. NPDC051981 TaxID=3155417 RepID=UPI003448D70D
MSRLRLTAAGATVMLNRLEKQGDIARSPHPTDRRCVIVVATDLAARRVQEQHGSLPAGVRVFGQLRHATSTWVCADEGPLGQNRYAARVIRRSWDYSRTDDAEAKSTSTVPRRFHVPTECPEPRRCQPRPR